MDTKGPNENKELSEKDFIHEEYSKKPALFWKSLGVVLLASALLWFISFWYTKQMNTFYKESPFLQVSNRQISLFLWQFTDYMRAHVKNKTGYLPGFLYIEKVGLDASTAEDTAVAPPEVLFLYHVWDLLLKPEFSPRPIPQKQFEEFLKETAEWQPEYWPQAPKAYRAWLSNLKKGSDQDLSSTSLDELPQEVRLAFQGWKNYFHEGDAINATEPTYAEMESFLAVHPHYARSYWSNILNDTYPDYLASFNPPNLQPEALIPRNELAPFLKVAFYNFKESKLGK
jgi:hypothetical protein